MTAATATAPPSTPTSDEAAELQRRELMAQSDSLLDDVEMLRLRDESNAPERLREAIRALQLRLGRRNPPVAPTTLDAAYDLVFAVQQRLMAANPRNPRPNRHVGRPSGQPVVALVTNDARWKILTLPPPTAAGDELEWIELVEATVERAWDRWCYAQQQAVRAARTNNRAHIGLAMARIAWSNYWELDQEAKAIKKRLTARPASTRGESRAALTA